jgi:transcriptional regulator with XRE-family HTH domain
VPASRPEAEFLSFVAGRLRAARLRAHLSQSAVARAVGVSHVSYGAWERGTTGIGLQHIARLAAVLGVPVDYLLGTQEVAPDPDLLDWLTHDEWVLTYGGRPLTPDQRGAFRAVAMRMAEMLGLGSDPPKASAPGRSDVPIGGTTQKAPAIAHTEPDYLYGGDSIAHPGGIRRDRERVHEPQLGDDPGVDGAGGC